MTVLDRNLVARTKRRKSRNAIEPRQLIAMNLFWRNGVRVPIIARVFHVSKNTIYYKALTGSADSYPNSPGDEHSARETNAIIDSLGKDEAWTKYVKEEEIKAINEEMARELERREAE
jgi:hypothetical protein